MPRFAGFSLITLITYFTARVRLQQVRAYCNVPEDGTPYPGVREQVQRHLVGPVLAALQAWEVPPQEEQNLSRFRTNERTNE